VGSVAFISIILGQHVDIHHSFDHHVPLVVPSVRRCISKSEINISAWWNLDAVDVPRSNVSSWTL
jgi:hypothetical protein